MRKKNLARHKKSHDTVKSNLEKDVNGSSIEKDVKGNTEKDIEVKELKQELEVKEAKPNPITPFNDNIKPCDICDKPMLKKNTPEHKRKIHGHDYNDKGRSQDKDKSHEKVDDRSSNKSNERHGDKFSTKSSDKSIDKFNEKPSDKSNDRTYDKSSDKSTEKVHDKPSDISSEKSSGKSSLKLLDDIDSLLARTSKMRKDESSSSNDHSRKSEGEKKLYKCDRCSRDYESRESL